MKIFIHGVLIYILGFILIVTGLTACTSAAFEGDFTTTAETSNNIAQTTLTGENQPQNEIAGQSASDTNAGRLPEAIQIRIPGTNSRVVSPLTIEGSADPALGKELTIGLYELNPHGGPQLERLLAEQVIDISTQSGSGGDFRVEFNFPASSQENVGWVLVSISDPVDGGFIHATNLPLVLLASGTSEITEAVQKDETIEIYTPQPNQIISGGHLTVLGFSEYFFESNLGLILCRTSLPFNNFKHPLCGFQEQVIASGNAMINAPDMGLPGPFSGTINYQVAEETPARLVVFATSPRDGSLLHLTSVEVILVP